jgi:hypothetical protein
LLAEKRKSATLETTGGQPYEATQVETLKTQILTALKDATNIRGIKQQDFVVVTVFGPPAAPARAGGAADPRGSILTLRVKKADIDDFAKSAIDLAKFKERATVTAYAGNGYGLSSVNTWVRTSGLQGR